MAHIILPSRSSTYSKKYDLCPLSSTFSVQVFLSGILSPIIWRKKATGQKWSKKYTALAQNMCQAADLLHKMLWVIFLQVLDPFSTPQKPLALRVVGTSYSSRGSQPEHCILRYYLTGKLLSRTVNLWSTWSHISGQLTVSVWNDQVTKTRCQLGWRRGRRTPCTCFPFFSRLSKIVASTKVLVNGYIPTCST
jgi:hypothetical protein